MISSTSGLSQAATTQSTSSLVYRNDVFLLNPFYCDGLPDIANKVNRSLCEWIRLFLGRGGRMSLSERVTLEESL